MSLALAAQHLASQGRNRDTELVHMSKPEVAGLQMLAQKHGGNLTRNPTTGLLEAGFLDSILPTVAGLGITYLSGGAIDPMTAGMLVGGGTTLMSGGNLQKGLMAGLGAYGGAGLGAGLMESGASTLAGQDALQQAAAQNAISAAPTPVASTATGFGGVGSDAAVMGNPVLPSQATGFGGIGIDPSVGRSGINGFAQAAPMPELTAPVVGTTGTTQAAQEVTQASMNPSYEQQAQDYAARYKAGLTETPGASMMQGLKNLGQPGGISNLTGSYLGGNMGALKYLGAAAAPTIMDMSSQPVGHTAASDYLNTVRPYTFSQYHNPNAPINSQTPYFTQTMTALPSYVAPYAGGGMAKGPARGESLRGTMGMLHGTEKLMTYSSGGISNLGSYSDGGQLLKGPGDGVSDDIPAQIGEHQPARLAEGEFVVPARIVSELGNGSTNAGAKRLYDMMNRIQAGRARTMGGKSAYAKDTNAEQHLPA